jgi:hypothetical protein
MWLPAQMGLAYGIMVQACWEMCFPWLFLDTKKK